MPVENAQPMSRNLMTKDGARRMQAELQCLKSEVRPRITRAIAEAREHGDLKENAEYHAAREQQSFVEGRISELETRLSNAKIIDTKSIVLTGKVIFGVSVRLLNLDTDERITYRIVGDGEADVKEHKISVHSPLARSIMDRETGEVVVVSTPGGEVEFEIEEIEKMEHS